MRETREPDRTAPILVVSEARSAPAPDGVAAEVAVVREAVIREYLRWQHGPETAAGPLPTIGAAKIYMSDVERYVRTGIIALEAHRAARKAGG